MSKQSSKRLGNLLFTGAKTNEQQKHCCVNLSNGLILKSLPFKYASAKIKQQLIAQDNLFYAKFTSNKSCILLRKCL